MINLVGDKVMIEFILDLAVDDVIAELQVSTDLQNWTDGASIFSNQTSQYLGTGGQLMRFEAERLALPADRYFLQLRILLVE